MLFGYLFPTDTLTLWMYIYLNEDQLFVQKCGFGHQRWFCTCIAHTRAPKNSCISLQNPEGCHDSLVARPRSFFPAPDLFCLKWLKCSFGNYSDWILTDLPVTNLHLKSNKSKGIFRCVQSSQQDEDFHEFYSMMRPNRDKLSLNLGDELLWVDLWLDVVGMFWPKAFGSGNVNHLVYAPEI